MKRLSFFLVVAAACGGSPKPTPTTTPLPDDKQPAPVAATPAPAPAPAPAPPPPQPIDLKVAANQTTVKLVSGGKGKREALRYAPKEGTKQVVELSMDFTGAQDAEEQTVPTMVLTGNAEAKTVAKDGGVEFALTVTAADARDAAAAKPDAPKVDIGKFKMAMSVLPGLTIGGTMGGNGVTGELTMHMDNPPPHAEQVLDLVRVTLPRVPVLPAEPVGVGAKWQATTVAKVADRLDVTQVTDYEVTAHKGTSWTIKGTTKITGKDQQVETSKVSDISGNGTTEATIDSAQVFPTFKSTLETQFKATTDKDKSVKYKVRVAGGIAPSTGTPATPAAAPAPATPPAPKK